MRVVRHVVSLLILGWCTVAQAGVVTPIPTPSYMIVGYLGEYRGRNVESSNAFGSFLSSSHPSGLQDRAHELNYEAADNTRYADLEVVEVVEGTWLQHEVEHHVRHVPKGGPYTLEMRQIVGQHVIYLGLYTGGEYVWVSGGNKAVQIQFPRRTVDVATMTSIPIEEVPESFVAAYLERLPSDLPAFQFDEEHERQWIRNEFDRQFYYLDRTMQTLSAQLDRKEQENTAFRIDLRLKEIVGLRAQYLGGPSVREWELDLIKRHQRELTGPDRSIVMTKPYVDARVNELKQWWAQHRDDPIVLPTATSVPTPAHTATP